MSIGAARRPPSTPEPWLWYPPTMPSGFRRSAAAFSRSATAFHPSAAPARSPGWHHDVLVCRSPIEIRSPLYARGAKSVAAVVRGQAVHPENRRAACARPRPAVRPLESTASKLHERVAPFSRPPMVPMRSSRARHERCTARDSRRWVLAPEPRRANGTAPARARKVRRESEEDMAGRYHNGSAGRYIRPRHVARRGDLCRVDQLAGQQAMACGDLSISKPVVRRVGVGLIRRNGYMN